MINYSHLTGTQQREAYNSKVSSLLETGVAGDMPLWSPLVSRKPQNKVFPFQASTRKVGEYGRWVINYLNRRSFRPGSIASQQASNHAMI